MTRKLIEKRVSTTSNNSAASEHISFCQIVEKHNLPALLTDKDVALLFNFSTSALRKMRCEGKSSGRSVLPPHVYIGGRVRYRIDDVRKWYDALNTRGGQ